MKRLLSTAMILSLLLSQVLIAQAADSAKASTLRLERTKGTVSLTNQSEKPLSCLDGMKLLSGYTLSTKAASYAYISLDENKAVKLDGLSASTVKQKGKKLELLLSSGKLFFDVKVPLASDETMEIRTSTMVTGIRGTAGIAQVISPAESTLLLLSGHVQTTSFDPVSGQIRTVQIQAGQLAHFTMHAGNPQPEVRIAPAQTSDIPAFAAMEIAGSPRLQMQIRNQTGLDLTALIAGVAKQLSADEAAQLERARLATAAMAAQTSLQSTTPLFPVQLNSTSSGKGSSWTPPSAVTLTGSKTAGEIQAELDKSAIKTVILSGTGTSTLDSKLTVPATKTLQLENNATLQTSSSTPLIIEGTVSVQQSASLRNLGTITDPTPGIIVNSTNSLDVAGTLTNDGLIHVGSLEMVNQDEKITPGKLSVLPGGSAINNGIIDIKKDSILESSASFESTGMVQNFGTISYISGLFLMDAVENAGNSPAIKMQYQNGSTSHPMYANTLADILKNVPTDTTLTLLDKPIAKTQIGSNPSLASGKKLTLNLGAQTIDLGDSQLVNEGNLTLIGDNNKDTIELSRSGQSSNALIKNSGTLVINDCIIENSGSGSVIDSHTNPSASLSITGNSKVTGSASSGVITVSAGNFSIFPDANNSDKLVVINNTNLADSYAVVISSGATALMTRGVITSTSGGVLMSDGASFTMEGGTVEANTCGVFASGTSLNKPTTFTMRSGAITSIQRGVLLADGANFTLENGSIEAVTNGVFFSDGSSATSKLTMSGGTIKTSSQADDIYAISSILQKNFTFDGGSIKAKTKLNVCPPTDGLLVDSSPMTGQYTIEQAVDDDNNTYYYLQKH